MIAKGLLPYRVVNPSRSWKIRTCAGEDALAGHSRTRRRPSPPPRGVNILPFLYYLPMTRVLLAEDDTSISEPLSRALRREGYEVDVTADGPSTLDKALGEGVDLILLDIRLPELRARVRALLRRGTAEGSAAHGVRIDPDARRAWHGDTELDLTTKEFDLLWILLRDAGKVVTREQIMREVWDAKWWTSTKTLDMHISWLRRKLGDDAHSPRYITTVRGVGFRFERGD